MSLKMSLKMRANLVPAALGLYIGGTANNKLINNFHTKSDYSFCIVCIIKRMNTEEMRYYIPEEDMIPYNIKPGKGVGNI